MQAATWPPSAAAHAPAAPDASLASPAAQDAPPAADGDTVWPLRPSAATPLPGGGAFPGAASDASRAQTPAPVKAADAEVAALYRRAADELPPSLGAPRLASPLGFRAPPPGFSPAAAAPLELGATSFDEDTETEAVFRRARDALLLQRARSAAPTVAVTTDGDELSEWSTDDGGVTWVKSARAQRRVAALAGRKAARNVPSQARAPGSPHRPLSPVPEPTAPLREAVRSIFLALAVYFIVVGVWHHVRPLLPEHVLERML